MAKFISQAAGKLKEVKTVSTSAGAADADKIPSTGVNGRLDPSLLTGFNAGDRTILDGEWQAWGASTSVPQAGRVYPNPGLTNLFLATEDKLGADRSVELSRISRGDTIYVRDFEGKSITFLVSGPPIANAGYYSIPFAIISGVWADIDITKNSLITFSYPISADAVSFTPAGNLVGTTVQAALKELDDEKVIKTAAKGSAVIPSGTTLERDATPSAGYQRWNSTLAVMEHWNGVAWATFGASDSNIDGGNALSVYLPSQNFNGGTA